MGSLFTTFRRGKAEGGGGGMETPIKIIVEGGEESEKWGVRS